MLLCAGTCCERSLLQLHAGGATSGLSVRTCTQHRCVCVQVRREVDYRRVDMLRAFTGRHGMLLGRRSRHIKAATQRRAARAVKNARQMALLPHVGLHPAFEDAATRSLRKHFEQLQAEAEAQGL